MKRAILGASWPGAISGPSWGHLGALLGPSWGHLGQCHGYERRGKTRNRKEKHMTGQFNKMCMSPWRKDLLWLPGAILGHLGAILGPFQGYARRGKMKHGEEKQMTGQFNKMCMAPWREHHFVVSWGHFGPSWGHLGPSWGHLGAILGRFRLTKGEERRNMERKTR